MLSIWIAFLVALNCLLINHLVRAGDELVAVTVLYRHADRTIAQSYPNDPYKNASFWPVPHGELTNVYRHGDRTISHPYPNDPYKNLSFWPVPYGELTNIYRHGDRTPEKFYPNDPYKDPSLWPTGMGQLTNIGKQQHYELGKWIRNRYNGFLSSTYEEEEIYVRSSDSDRCIMSAASNLAGLYPPEGKDEWNEELEWQPIPIHSVPKIYDDIAEFKTSCSKFKKLRKKVRSEYFQDYDKENEVIYEYITEKTGEKIKNFQDASSIYGILRVEHIYNFTLPDWSVKLYPKLKEFYALSKKLLTYTPELTRLANGRLFDNIISQFTYFKNKTIEVEEKPKKFKVFSVHDTEISCVLNAFNVSHSEEIPYAAVIIFELRKPEDGQLHVQVLYKTTETADPIHVQDCNTKCEFENFVKILKPMSLTEGEFKDECHN